MPKVFLQNHKKIFFNLIFTEKITKKGVEINSFNTLIINNLILSFIKKPFTQLFPGYFFTIH